MGNINVSLREVTEYLLYWTNYSDRSILGSYYVMTTYTNDEGNNLVIFLTGDGWATSFHNGVMLFDKYDVAKAMYDEMKKFWEEVMENEDRKDEYQTWMEEEIKNNADKRFSVDDQDGE